MVTYVLGAGASCHAGYPLAGELGNALRDWIHREKSANHKFRVHIDQLHELYGGLGDIEDILTALNQCLPGSRAATLQGPIRGNIRGDFRLSIREFFNALREKPAALYARLARERIQPGDVVITFNYEAACERQLKEGGLWEIGDGYGFALGLESIPLSKVKVLKLHGSTNWWGLIFRGSRGVGAASDSLGPRPAIFFRPDLEFLGYSSEVRDPLCAGIDNAAGHLAVIMPTRRKHFFEQTPFGNEWEPFWEDLWKQAEDAVQSSGKTVFIGYGMADADEKARELLLEKSNRSAEIEIWCGGRSTAIRDEFAAKGFKKVRACKKSHFENYLDAVA